MTTVLTLDEETLETSSELVFGLARTRRQREEAYRLVYESYLQSGLGAVNPYGMRVTPYQLRASTQIFVGEIRDEVVSTVTLVADEDDGLPMESIYADEVAALRAQGIAVAEVSCLADRRKDPRRFLAAFCELMRYMAQYARRQGTDQLLIAVHPRHARFYGRYISFEQIGGVASCSYVQNRPAVAMSFEFAKFDRERPPSYEKFFGVDVPEHELEPYVVPPEEMESLRPIVAASCGLETPLESVAG